MGGYGNPVPVERQIVERLIAHIRNGTTDLADSELNVPIGHFTDPERAEQELALLRRRPVIAAHISEIAEPGAFITREILGMPLLIVRRQDGGVAVYRNMCRHRGGRVEQKASGRKRRFMCQYHGWSYDGDSGELKTVPFEESYGGVDRTCSGLLTVWSEVAHGLVFVVLTETPGQPIVDYLGADVDGQLAPWGLADATLYMEKQFMLAINWKLVMDGAIDSLHAQFLHPKPGGVGSRSVTNVAVFERYGWHGKMFQPRSRLKRLVDEGGDLAASSQYVSSVLMLYPNAMVIGAPDHVEFWTIWPSPKNPAESSIQIRFLVRRDILSEEMEARINKSWDILSDAALTEDFPMEEWIQHNALAWPDGSFRYGRNEVSAQHLHRRLAEDLAAG